MVGTLTISTLMVVIPVFCVRVSTTVASDTINEAIFIRGQQCSILWLPIGILYGAKCGCKYPFGSLLLVRIDG